MIKIIIDSAADICADEAKELGVTMVPMYISFGEEEFLDGETLTAKQFYEKLEACNVIPKTSLINEYRWEEVISSNLSDGDEIIIITISSKLSGTYLAAKSASEKFNGRVRVIDSLNAAIGERMLIIYAINLVKQGLSLDEITELLENNKSRVKVYAIISTLEYLKKGGRISSATAFAGSLLSIKPIIAVDGGEIKIVSKALGEKKGYKALNKLVEESGAVDKSMPYGVVYSGTKKDLVEKFISTNAESWCGDKNVKAYLLGGTVGSHVGAGVVGVSYFANK